MIRLSRLLAAMAVIAAAAIFLGACASRQDYVLPANLRLNIEGRPLVEGPEATVLLLETRSQMPVVKLEIAGPWGHAVWAPALVDTGAMMYMDLPHFLARRARPWVWLGSVGRVRTWSFGEERTSLGVLEGVSIGDTRLSHMPVNLSPKRSERPGAILGISALSLFDSVGFDWERGTMTLRRRPPGPVETLDDPRSEPGCVPFRWWHPMGGETNRGRGYVVVDGAVGAHKVDLWIDTGCGGDLVLPRSLAQGEPWASALEENGSIKLFSATGTTTAGRFKLRGRLTIGGESFTDLLVAVFDDSTLPPGATALPILGTPLLRKFARVTIDFANERVIFERSDTPERPE